MKKKERAEYIRSLVHEAHEEDAREGGHFDREGWANFFPEDLKRDPEAVAEAWAIYELQRQ